MQPEKLMIRMRHLLSLVLLVLLVQCAWFQKNPPAAGLIKPEPIEGYASLRQYIYYPRAIREAGIEGTVRVNVFVSPEGQVTQSRVVQPLNPVLDEIALQAIRKTRFSPATKGGQPLGVWIAIPIVFGLNDWVPANSPFKTIELRVRPNVSFGQFRVTLVGQLKSTVSLPLRLELLLPFNAERPTVSSGGVESGTANTILDGTDEWLIFEATKTQFSMSFTYHAQQHQFSYKFAMNLTLPDWKLIVINDVDAPTLSRSPDRQSRQADGMLWSEFNMTGQEPYEPRFLELGLSTQP